ncbi:MAG: hypothetical protein IH823_04655 [Candidatus Dadabacteria bacterium]|nr:hypothetical protein [Candidatus Dadabacteria bacterium]
MELSTKFDAKAIESQVKEYIKSIDLEKQIFDKESFDDLYKDVESFFYSDKISISYKILIGNFESETSIKINDNLQIRPMTISERSFSEDKTMLGVMNQYYSLSHVIEHIVYEEKLFGDEKPKDAQNRINKYEVPEKILSALRLFKKGKIHSGVFMTQATSSVHNMGTSWSERGLRFPTSSSKYTLNSTEASEFIKLWKLISDSRYHQSKSVSIAIRRFNYAYDREKNDDEIIDYLISFEALFFKSETQELSEKLSRRVARLLEDNFDNRKKLSKNIKDFYNKRSKIVHGIETEISSEYVDEIQEVLRKSIKKVLEKILTQHHDDIIDHLDFD